MKTIRQQIMERLEDGPRTGIEISQMLGIREKEVYEHLPHVAQSVLAQGRKLIIHPSECLKCGYIFKDRTRFTRPSRCPKCRETHIQRPAYEIK